MYEKCLILQKQNFDIANAKYSIFAIILMAVFTLNIVDFSLITESLKGLTEILWRQDIFRISTGKNISVTDINFIKKNYSSLKTSLRS